LSESYYQYHRMLSSAGLWNVPLLYENKERHPFMSNIFSEGVDSAVKMGSIIFAMLGLVFSWGLLKLIYILLFPVWHITTASLARGRAKRSF
ncbi:MAG: hypothetical protein QF389_09850, partial [Planctomycetota bacterium]|nr:hypothetical protein [Planctomycetota bacterium]